MAAPSRAAHDHAAHQARAAAGAQEEAPLPEASWESLQERLERLSQSDPQAAAGLRSFLEDVDPASRARALALGLYLVSTAAEIEDLEARASSMSPRQLEERRARLFARFDAAMLRQMPRPMHASFMSRMAPLFKVLDGDLVQQHAEHWLRADPGAASSQFSAEQNLAKNKLQAALADAAQAARYDPSSPGPYEVLADANYKLGNYDAARDAALRLRSIDPGNPVAEAHLKLSGRGHEDAQPPGPAPASAPAMSAPLDAEAPAAVAFGGGAGQAAAVTDPDVLRSGQLAKEAKEALKRRDLDVALSRAQEAVRRNPRNVEAMYYESLAYARKDQFREALAQTAAGLALAPGNPALLAGRALIYNLMMLYKEALAESDRALLADPSNYHAFFTKAWALAGLGRRGDALAALKRATRLSEYRALYERAMQLPEDADLLPLFRGELAPKAAAPGRGETDERRFLLYGALILVVGFLIALAVLNRLYGDRAAPGPEPAAPTPGGSPANGAQGPALIAGIYRVLRKLGVGGMGVVYEAIDQTLERKVAIKKMREEIRADPRERERFLREARTVAALRHPNIVEIYSIVEDGEDAYLVFEHVDGKTVHDVIQSSGKLPFPEAMDLLRGAAAALDYAHARGVIHRDLKPSNIMVDREGRVKVMDFGVARQAKDSLSRLSMTNTVVGTPPYMAPEQEQGAVRRESDVYALAVCLYEMLTGGLPFAGMGAGMLMSKLNKNYIPATARASGLPGGLDASMARALDPDPDLRFPSAGAFLASLEALGVPR